MKNLKIRIRKPLRVSDGKKEIDIPKDYILNVHIRCYGHKGRELCDFEVHSDGEVIKESVLLIQVGCDHVQFVD
jgi:hypothetical protein